MNAWYNFLEQARAMTADFSGYWVQHPWSNIAVICWLFTSVMCCVAVLCRSVRDTVLERVALGAICLGSLGRAFFVFGRGRVEVDEVWVAVALAFYCLALWWKYFWVIPRRPDYRPPHKMPRY